MLFEKGLQKAAKSGGGGVVQTLTLDNPEGWLTGDHIALSRDKAMKVSTVSRCVTLRAGSMAALPIYVMDERSKERIPGHRLAPVLWGRPNEAMTRLDYEMLMSCNKYLKGNAYAWIFRNRATGWPEELIPLPSDSVTPYVNPKGKLWYVFFHPRTGETTWIPPEDMLHYKEYSEDGLEGISILQRAAQSIQTDLSAQGYERDMYDNGGRPSGVLTADADLSGYVDVKDSEGKVIETISKKERLRREWDAIHRGPGRQFRTAVLDLGLKYQTVAMNNSDAQFIESKEVRVMDVCRFFGVPPHMAFAGKQSYNSNEQNAIEFVNFTMLPDTIQREQEDTSRLLLPSERAANQRIKRELKVFLRGDTTAQAAFYKAMREVGGYSANDIRALDDRGPIPGGDTYYASWNYGPMDLFSVLSALRNITGVLPDDVVSRIESELISRIRERG